MTLQHVSDEEASDEEASDEEASSEPNISGATMETHSKKLPILEEVSAGVYPTTTCSFCDSGNRNITTNHYCTMESNDALFWKDNKQICGKATCIKCKEKKGIECANRCATCFFTIPEKDLKKMKVGNLRALADNLDYAKKTKKTAKPNKKTCLAFLTAEFNSLSVFNE